MRATDFHSHILPGIDDGSKDVDMSLEMLSVMARTGIEAVVATPHFYGSRRSLEHFLERRERACERLAAALKGFAEPKAPVIHIGAEVAMYSGLTSLDGIEKLCIKGTKTMLLEMPFAPWTDLEINEVADICSGGIEVAIAHIERYADMQSDNAMARLLALPVHVQVNAETLLPMFGRKRWLRMFESGQAELLGSDCHNLSSRAPNLAEGRNIIKRKLGEDALRRIDQNAERLLSGAESLI